MESAGARLLVTSFKRKINKMGLESQFLYPQPTIVSRSNTLSVSAQRYGRPRLVSIGPVHHGDPNLKNMEDYKWWLLHISSFGSFSIKELSVCFRGLKDLEQQSRRTYSVVVNMTSDDFVEMLFLDACFIILLYLGALETHHQQFIQQAEDPSLSTACANFLSEIKIRELLSRLRSLNVNELITGEAIMDIYVLDNQIPFFIIEYMWKWLAEALRIESSLDFYRCLRVFYDVPSDWPIPNRIHHILDAIHSLTLPQPSGDFKLYDRYYRPWIPNVAELKESGIKFKLQDPGNPSLIITCEEGVMHIPELYLTESQRLLLENLMEFEQSVRGDHSTNISNFIWIMSCLLSKEDDVRILRSRSSFKYLKGWDKEVQRFFHNLEQRCSYWKVDTDLETLFREINISRKSQRRRVKAIFQRKLCRNLWVTLSVTGAIILFVLTFLQTFFAMYSYFRPPNR